MIDLRTIDVKRELPGMVSRRCDRGRAGLSVKGAQLRLWHKTQKGPAPRVGDGAEKGGLRLLNLHVGEGIFEWHLVLT